MAVDRDENTALMLPLLIGESSRHRTALVDLAVDLAAKASGFKHSLPEGVRSALADLVRAMNCYYSNLIEGHDTHPVDIERALNDDYSNDAGKRNLQMEARAHINVQRWIDSGGLRGRSVLVGSICEIHRRFTELLPEDLQWVTNPKTGRKWKLVPGELRQRDVQVGRHIPVSAGAIPRFLDKFSEAYQGLGKADAIVAIAAAHHRLLWIHPFLDGNGRVARLFSHAMLLDTLDTGGVWSVARGLARNVDSYKKHLAACDLHRRNDLDGRGNLSEEELANFTSFFLKVCIDQVSFMEELVQPDKLRARLMLWAAEESKLGKLPPKAINILEAVLYRGELPRGEVGALIGTTDRHARRIMAPLIKCGVVKLTSARTAWCLAFPATLTSRLMPGLFPDKS